jgi:hypothetical protein
LGLQTLNQIAKRVSKKTLKDERYDCLLPPQDFYKKNEGLQIKRALEDSKFILENMALWLILYLGDTGHLSHIEMGVATIGILATRLFVDLSLNRKNETLNKVAKLAPLFEFLAGVVLCSVMMGGIVTPDDTLWAFFGVQLFLMVANQIAKRTLDHEEGYECFMACRGQKQP